MLTSPPARRMLLRLPRCATYSPISSSCLCDDHPMGAVIGAKPAKAPSPVLCVDLDGTLIRGDLFWECILVLLRTRPDRKSTRLNSSHLGISYAVFCLKKN